MKLKPIKDRIFVKPEIEEKKGLIIVKDDTKPTIGIVVAVGKEVLELSEGDRIYFGKYAGSSISVNDEDYLIMDEKEVLGIIG